ncbi:putative Holliday junction resolvase [Pseudobythopirellula maris]|uniref:Putative pre-16S rRNA nuclease n=1 Tax=Pseudobythopirellula maris TaxID=2527991 RepID=A0A5C5ZMM9_9BACT|nr:Holliday junction resolvase RuvX [Pseudobythopirellula maris]TWT87703.1 putative Holliday junction resolvase [Pseudobythopirellula maris]
MNEASSDNPAPPALPQRGRIAGIDYGTVRIGVAIGDLEVRMASPLENYNRRSEALDAKYFKQLAQEERLVRWVVGLPVHLDGGESQKSQEARRFANWLTDETGVPHEFFDERYTSAQAEEVLLAAGLTSKRRKARLDALAAQIMLTAYLESGAKGQDDPGGID